ncbi:molybdopterin biosynthesis protein MoeB, partial [Xanthomonas sp. Kuri4-2]
MAIHDITPEEARQRIARGAVFIDVRAEHERAAGQAEGARGIEQATLLADPATALPDAGAEILLICQTGKRSADTAAAL